MDTVQLPDSIRPVLANGIPSTIVTCSGDVMGDDADRANGHCDISISSTRSAAKP